MEPSSAEDGNDSWWLPSSMIRSLQWSRPQLRTETGDSRVGNDGTRTQLQWSRPQLRTETLGMARHDMAGYGLQWSRPQLRTETITEGLAQLLYAVASMEPSSAEDGNETDYTAFVVVAYSFNGAVLS